MVRLAAKRVHKFSPGRKSWLMAFLEAAHGVAIEDQIRRAVNSSKTLHDAAAKLGIDYVTLWRWQKRLGMR